MLFGLKLIPKGEPVTGVNAPLPEAMAYTEMLFDSAFAT